MTTMGFQIEDNELFSTIISNNYNCNMLEDIIYISNKIDEIPVHKEEIINSLFFGLVFFDNNGEDETIGYVIANNDNIQISLDEKYNITTNKEIILESIKKTFKDNTDEKCYIIPKKN